MSRWKAGAIHFSISLMVFLVLLAIILLLWYPGILFSIDGGWTGLQIVIGVDLVLGPLLTLIVFKSGKPGLKFDLSCIVTAQVVCMAAGMWIVYAERPLALVLAYDTIYSVTEQEFIDYEKNSEILEEFEGSYPKLIFVELPEGEVQRDIAAIRSQFIGDPLYIQTENYRGFPEKSEDITSVFQENEMIRAQISEELATQLPASCLLSKFVSAVTSGYVCFDPEEQIITNFYANEYSRVETGA
ncbi:MAG: hypothetical protein GKR91_13955 [Pseudomonadales bacterium]|nr:hypothetical protein [Pseudomonadales bacterium]